MKFLCTCAVECTKTDVKNLWEWSPSHTKPLLKGRMSLCQTVSFIVLSCCSLGRILVSIHLCYSWWYNERAGQGIGQSWEIIPSFILNIWGWSCVSVVSTFARCRVCCKHLFPLDTHLGCVPQVGSMVVVTLCVWPARLLLLFSSPNCII